MALLLLLTAVVTLQAAAALLRRTGDERGLTFYWLAQLAFSSVLGWLVLRRPLDRRAVRRIAVLVTIVPTLLYRMTDPLILTAFDEQLHLRSLVDLVRTHGLQAPQPTLPISPFFPGLEVAAAIPHTLLGLPLIASVTLVTLGARTLLGLALVSGAFAVGASPRTAGLVVLLYAACPQFYFFNSQFAYQTLALSLGLASLVLVRQAQVAGGDRTRLGVAAAGFAACVVTHHITGWMVLGFMVAWYVATPRDRGRRTVAFGAAAVLLAVLVWDGAVSGGLYRYLAPVAQEAGLQLSALAKGQSTRHYFQDTSGEEAPLWQRLLLLGYAGTASLLAVLAGLHQLRRGWRGRNGPRLLVALLALAYPLTLLSRVSSATSEMGDRSSTFIFFPWALCVGLWLVALMPTYERRVPQRLVAGSVSLLVGVLWVGAVALGTGPDWERLPGPWLPAAENRSLDVETLAAASWADDALPAGSRIVADRMPSTLLASSAQLWSVTQGNSGVDVANLYFADFWGPPQTQLVRQAHVAYLYVDRRLASGPPRVGAYFYKGETAGRERLTAAQLAKFDAVPGLRTVYRHGPVVIYHVDPVALGVTPELTGSRQRHEPPVRWWHLLLGLVVGGPVAYSLRRRRAATRTAAGTRPAGREVALVWATAVPATVVLVGTAVYAVHLPLSWLVGAGLGLPQLVWWTPWRGRLPRRPAHPVFAAVCCLTLAIWVTNSVLSAYDTDVMKVRRVVGEATTQVDGP